MRIMGFEKEWTKLRDDTFTTFRFERKDKDWITGESVQIIIKPRSKDRKYKGIALIIFKELRSPDAEFLIKNIPSISDEEAIRDGFEDYEDMLNWLIKVYGYTDKLMFKPISKLTLRWLSND